MAGKFKIGYLPLTKVNWTNETLEKARADAIAYLEQLPGVEVIAPEKMLCLEDQALSELDRFEKEQPDLIIATF